MAIKVAELETAFTGNTRSLDRAFSQSEQRAKTFASNVNKSLSNIGGGGGGAPGGGLFSSIAGGIQLIPGLGMLAGGLLKVAGAVQAGIKVGFDYNRILEENTIAFEVMLGSVDKAAAHLKDLARFAETSPFEFPEIIGASKRMQAMGFSIKEIIPTLRAVSDASSALGTDMDGIILALGQMRQKGKVSAEEMNQLVERGIPAWEILAKAIGKTVQETQKLSRQGQLSGVGAAQAIAIGINQRYGGIGKRVAEETASGLEANLNDIASRLAGTATGPMFEQYKNFLRKTLNIANSEVVGSLARGAAQVTGGAFDAIGGAVSTGADMAGGLLKGISGTGVKAAAEFLGDFRKGIGAQSPATQFIPIGEDAAEGFMLGFSTRLQVGGGIMGLFQTGVSRRQQNESLLDDPRIRAMLDVIGYSEGTDKLHGYATKVGGRHQGSLDRKNRSIVNLGGGLRSSASGRYQFLNSTWDSVASRLGLTDFSPRSQDVAAIELLRQRGAIGPLMQGNFRGAISSARKEWASFPGAGYGQGERSMSSLERVFQRSLGGAVVGGGASSRPVPVTVVDAPYSSYGRGENRFVREYREGLAGAGGGANLPMNPMAVGSFIAPPAAFTQTQDPQLAMLKAAAAAEEFRTVIGLVSESAEGMNSVLMQTEPIIMKVEESAKFLGLEVEGIKQGFEDAFVNAFGNIEQGFKGMLTSFALGFAQTLQQMAAQMMASQLSSVLGKIIGIAGGALSGGFGGAAKATTGAGLAGGFAAGFGGGKASGGPVSGGWLYQVNEGGRKEFFQPNSSGRIYNQQQMGNSVNIMVNVPVRSAGSYSSPRARREIGDAVKAALQGAI